VSRRKPPARPHRPRPTEGQAIAVTGAAGSGKTAWVIQQVRASPRLLVWDSGYDFLQGCNLLPVKSLQELGEIVRLGVRDRQVPQRIAYTGPVTVEHFITFCKLAYVWLRSHPHGDLVVDELADVTHPGKATRGWGEIVRKHRKFRYGRVFAITQRPAESDKSIMGNATAIHCGRMNLESDEVYMARYLRVPPAEIAALHDLEYLELNKRTKQLSRGTVTFR
jgi:hypothetical protein